MQLCVVLLLCCVAAAVPLAPTSALKETMLRLKNFKTDVGLQDGESFLSVEPGCYSSALECFRANLLNLTITSTRAKGRQLCKTLNNPPLKAAVISGDPGNTTGTSCQSCDSFPNTAVELVHQLNRFLERVITVLTVKLG